VTVDIVIVNWNSGGYLAGCIRSMANLGAEARAIASVSIVDNASNDSSENVDAADLPLKIVRNRANVGFGAACNIGARCGGAELILFLNPDTRLEANSIAGCAAHLHDDVWVVGARLIGDDGLVQRTCCRAATAPRMIARALGLDRLVPATGYVMTDWAHDETRLVDHVIGAFYLIRRDVFERLGGFDERFFVYLEDLDLSMRVRSAGGRCLFAADATAHHAGGGTTRSIKATRLFYSVRSRLQFAAKHFGTISKSMVWVVSLTMEPLLRSARAVSHRSKQELFEVWRGYAQLFRWISR
jgi:N-acetylglucosaminyl-diphospho-decaprenol L-rhamnosyltransferase